MEGLEVCAPPCGHHLAGSSPIEIPAINRQVSGSRRDIDHLPRAPGRVGHIRRLYCQRRYLFAQDPEWSQGIHGGVVIPAHGQLKFLTQLVERPPVDRTNGLLECVVPIELPVHLCSPPVTVRVGQPAVNLSAQRIDDGSRDRRELAQARQPTRQSQLAQDHVVASVLASGPQFGQPLTPPQWKTEPPRTGRLVVTLRLNVDLEDVDHLVAYGMTEFREISAERNRYPALQKIGDAQQPFRWGEG